MILQRSQVSRPVVREEGLVVEENPDHHHDQEPVMFDCWLMASTASTSIWVALRRDAGMTHSPVTQLPTRWLWPLSSNHNQQKPTTMMTAIGTLLVIPPLATCLIARIPAFATA